MSIVLLVPVAMLESFEQDIEIARLMLDAEIGELRRSMMPPT